LNTLSAFLAAMSLAFGSAVRTHGPSLIPPAFVRPTTVEPEPTTRNFALGVKRPPAPPREFAAKHYILRADTLAQSQGQWGRIGKGAAVGLLLGAGVGILIGHQEDRRCTEGPCAGVAVRGIEFGLLGALVGAVVGGHWPR
jgi:hypothetical protein